MCAAFQAHSIGLTVICKWPSQVEVPATEDATYRITHVVLQPAMPGWHCSRIEIVIELRVARSGALLVCSFCAIFLRNTWLRRRWSGESRSRVNVT